MNGQRLKLGKFSRPLYRDLPFGALVRDGLDLPEPVTAAALLADRRHALLVKDGYSYGSMLDGLIARISPRRVRTSVDPLQMALMLRSGRADWMIVAPEEAQVLGGAGLRLVALADAPPGPTRHLYCSLDVPDAWMARIDAALPPLPR
jgi:polar amino acid transport system substrate-binding protein